MFRTFLIFVFSLCSFSNVCFGERYIISTKYDDQDEILVQGASIIVSNKINSIFMYQTSETIKNYRANFYFKFTNCENNPINLLFSNLKVTDQLGRPIKVMHKSELINDKKSEMNWKSIASALCTGLESMNAQNAGKVDYSSHTNSRSHSNFNAQSSRGWASGSANALSSSSTYGTIHNEAARQQALRQVQEDARYRNETIQNNYNSWEDGLNDFYFDSTTVFPDTSYAANFQIDLTKNVEKELTHLLFTFEIENELHTFCFYCGEEKKKSFFSN
jgi:hypothetical protein